MKKNVDIMKVSPKYLASAFDKLVNCKYTIVAIDKYLAINDINSDLNKSLTFSLIPIKITATEIAKFPNARAIPRIIWYVSCGSFPIFVFHIYLLAYFAFHSLIHFFVHSENCTHKIIKAKDSKYYQK